MRSLRFKCLSFRGYIKNKCENRPLAAHRRIDCLVNCAASFLNKGLDVTTADWERSLGVNVPGGAHMVQACSEPMRQQGGAIVALTQCQALDLAPHNFRVNVVSPGWIWTPEVQKAANNDHAKWEPVWGEHHVLRRLGEPMEVARAILFLCSDDASFITSTELPVDGGYMSLGSEGLGETALFSGTA